MNIDLLIAVEIGCVFSLGIVIVVYLMSIDSELRRIHDHLEKP